MKRFLDPLVAEPLGYLALFLVAMWLLAGCSALQAVNDNPVAARLVVQQATMRYIESRTDWPDTAANVVSAAEAVQAAASGEGVTLAHLRQVALDAAGLDDLSPADRALAEGLIDTVALVVEERIGQGSLSGLEEVTTLRAIAGWAADAARTYDADTG